MAKPISQKSYLQKYLSGSSGDKKKKKKVTKGKGLKIFVDDIDISRIRNISGDELDILDQGEDAPQIAGIIDDRPEEVKKLEQFNTTSKWRVISKDDGFNSKIEIEEIKKKVAEKEKENEIVFGKMYSDNEDHQDSDLSPPRKNCSPKVTKKGKNTLKSSPQKSPINRSPKRDYRTNLSRKQLEKPKHYDSDASPPRRQHVESKKTTNHPEKCLEKPRNYDSDVSPPRRQHVESKKTTKQLEKPRNYDSDVSPPRRQQSENKKSTNLPEKRSEKPRNYDSDASPPRRHQTDTKKKSRTFSRWGEDETHKTVLQSSSNSPKIIKKTSKSSKSFSSQSPTITSKNTHAKSITSPTRASVKEKYRDLSPTQRHRNSDSRRTELKRLVETSTGSPRPWKRRHHLSSLETKSPSPKRRVSKSDSDPSPVRLTQHNRLPRIPESPSNKADDRSPRMKRTLDGKLAGLQDAHQLRQENESYRMREDDAFGRMNDEISGRNAQTVSRKKPKNDPVADKEKADKQKALDELYKKWNKGIKQVEDQSARVQSYMHEAAKPLARHRGDVDLESSLKSVERAGDPMLEYLRGRKRERGELEPERPKYKGNYMPNRFNIPPGYRWDGVDRSNGYEKKYFETQSNKRSQEEDYYKWATSDM